MSLPTTLALPAALRSALGELGVSDQDARLSLLPGGSRSTDAKLDAYLVLPSPDRPQLLVPLDASGGELIAERRSGNQVDKVVKRALSSALRRGYAAQLPGPRLLIRGGSLRRLIEFASSGACHSAGVMWGPPRANRKPVLRIFDAQANTWGYAKVGINELTNELVAAEADRLARVNALTWRTLRPPRVLLDDSLDGRRVLTTAPLAGAGAERQPSELPLAATQELFAAVPTTDATLATILGTPAEGTDARVVELTELTVARWGGRLLPVGASHGDWTPWNMAYSSTPIESTAGERVLDVWDWERFETDRPLGFDIVHFACSSLDAARPEAADPGSAALAVLPGQFAACGLDPLSSDAVLAAYLLLIVRRYDADLAREPVASLARRREWALDLLARHLHHTPDRSVHESA